MQVSSRATENQQNWFQKAYSEGGIQCDINEYITCYIIKSSAKEAPEPLVGTAAFIKRAFTESKLNGFQQKILSINISLWGS